MTRTLVNGQMAGSVSAFDRGLQFGDGLFETLAVVAGKPLLIEDHLERLAAGCARLGFCCPDKSLLRAEITSLAAGWDRAVIKLLVTRGESGRGYVAPASLTPNRFLYLAEWPAWLTSEYYAKGLTAHLCVHRLSENPALAGIKHLNRLDQVRARAEWPADAVMEGLMLDQHGFVVEGVSSNLFIENNGQIHTPALDRCGVAGVVRQKVLDTLEVKVSRLGVDDIMAADALYLTNSLMGVMPVACLSNRVFDPAVWKNAPIMALNKDLGLC